MWQLAISFKLDPSVSVLDVGGTPDNWLMLPPERRPRVTLLNLEAQPTFAVPDGMSYVQGDGTRIGFPDGAFDLVYSNSVIEHVGTLEQQALFAREIQRVGRRYYVQTPNRWFPLEPHIFCEPGVYRPLMHYLPRAWQLKVMPAWYQGIRLLTAREVRTLFSDAELWRECVAGLTKSLIAVKH